MTDKKGGRRKLLKTIAAGSGAVVAGKSLPESWSKPVVDSVMLPAHAATSPSPPPGDCGPNCAIAGCYGIRNETIDVLGDLTVTVQANGSVVVRVDGIKITGDRGFIDAQGTTECLGAGGFFTATGQACKIGGACVGATVTGTIGCNNAPITDLKLKFLGETIPVNYAIKHNGAPCGS